MWTGKYLVFVGFANHFILFLFMFVSNELELGHLKWRNLNWFHQSNLSACKFISSWLLRKRSVMSQDDSGLAGCHANLSKYVSLQHKDRDNVPSTRSFFLLFCWWCLEPKLCPFLTNFIYHLRKKPTNPHWVTLLYVTWSGESFPSSATILLRQATEPNRGRASPTLRYLCPLVLNTRITHSDLPAKKKKKKETHNQG